MIHKRNKGSVMKRTIFAFLFGTFSLSAMAAPLGSVTKAVIPADVQQIINVDYRSMQNSPSAQALKAKVLPDQLKQFETALKSAGINPDTDVERLTFASFRVKDQPLHIVGVASGAFALPKVITRLKAKKVKFDLYRKTRIYPMGSSGLSMSLLDDFTMLFGDSAAVKLALDARDSEIPSLTTNGLFSDMIAAVESD